LSLILIILLIALLSVTFSIFDPLYLKNEAYFSAVDFSGDGTTVIIYLDGLATVAANNAHAKSLALMGHNFFEAAVIPADCVLVYISDIKLNKEAVG